MSELQRFRASSSKYQRIFIVVGSGSAGSVVAARLSEDADNGVLLLEAGSSAEAVSAIWDPNLINSLYYLPSIHWGYKTVPQPRLAGRVMDVWRAKVTGGCASHNDMVYTRGARADFDGWVADFGCDGWGYDDVAPSFAAVEATLSTTLTTRNAFGHDYVDACVDIGLPYNPDYNSGGTMKGVSPHRSTIDANRRRVTSFESFVARHRGKRSNLFVLQNATVECVLFSGQRATGVSCIVDGVAQTFSSATEIIVSAGAINSPLLLMRSGIGKPEVLRRAGVGRIRAALHGVGANLQNAMIFKGVWKTRQPILDQPTNLGYAIVFDNMTSDGRPRTCLEMTRGTYDYPQTQAQLEGHYVVTGGAMCLESRGSVELASTDRDSAPIIDMNFLSTQGDFEQMRDAFDLMRRVGNSPGLSRWRLQELSPGPAVTSSDDISTWLRTNSYSYSHPVGTCAMGTSSDAVVDPRLRVLGVEGLRVVDASVMPRITAGHTQAPAMMVGEHGARMIRQDFGSA